MALPLVAESLLTQVEIATSPSSQISGGGGHLHPTNNYEIINSIKSNKKQKHNTKKKTNKKPHPPHRINLPKSSLLSPLDSLPSLFGNALQNLSVSSPAPVTIVSPSGDIARYSTRCECPVSDATMSSDGYFQMQIWFCADVEEKPCVETSSCEVRDHVRLQTCSLSFQHIRIRQEERIYTPGCPCPTSSASSR